MTQVNFITYDRMLRNPYLYENRIFTSKVNACNIVRGGKGKRVMLIKRVN